MQKLFIGLSLLLALGGCAQSYEKSTYETPRNDSASSSKSSAPAPYDYRY